MQLEICIHTHSYQHRLCWMLSSLLQQQGNIPNLKINVSFTPNNGNPTTKDVLRHFRNRNLDIDETILTPEQVSNRSIARNIQLKNTQAEWILFADSDLVYDPHLFADLKTQLETNLKDVTLVMGADRYSLDIPFCIKHFEEDKTIYPTVIHDVANICSKYPVGKYGGKHTCAGYFQLANVQQIRAKCGMYSNRENDLWRNTKGDRRFRIQMGGRLGIDTKPIYHLNHDRGGPDIQR